MIPDEAWKIIKRWAKRKALDTKWKANADFTPEMESIYLSMVQSALEIGAVKGYELAKKENDE
jgi:hypothetical protein